MEEKAFYVLERLRVVAFTEGKVLDLSLPLTH